ncbi:MAG: DNA polymerase II large subunit [Candidatus Woesearchaeota archaeon]
MTDYGMAASDSTNQYFDYLVDHTQKAYDLAEQARKKSYDPEDHVEIKLAKNMAERVVGIISVMAPQIVDSGVTKRIIELENEYGSQDWRVAFIIAHEIAQQKYCTFEDEKEAIEIGVRTGFAYVTVGVVSSPLEGLTSIDIKPRRDGQGNYFRLNYAGPIRNAGGTAAATSVLIADYVRKRMGYAKYDPDDKEVQRCAAELEDYHQYVANLQYYPFKEESEFLMKHIPVEIAGDPSEKRELSNAGLKDLPRIETNHLRSGYCLIHSSCIPLKAPKLWKKLSKWGHDMGMEDWDFLEDHIKLQKDLKSKGGGKEDEKQDKDEPKVKPDWTFVKDIVGGRPVLGHPMRSGSFRLRYGRSRASGLMTQSAHPATMAVLNDLIAIGTQMKVERPGKGALFTPCDQVMGPTVRLKDGSVKYLDSREEADKVSKHVDQILYLGDALIDYGDFFDRAHPLIPAGYCEEWWILDVKKALAEKDPEGDTRSHAKLLQLPESLVKGLLEHPLTTRLTFKQARQVSDNLSVPLHPAHTPFYKEVTKGQVGALLDWLTKATYTDERVTLPYTEGYEEAKNALELLAIPHDVEDGSVIIEDDHAEALTTTLGVRTREDAQTKAEKLKDLPDDATGLDAAKAWAPYEVKDKSGSFIGARMGRPEKAKMRKMTGSPHTLFPVGDEGGRLRSFQSALEKGKVTADFPVQICPSCGTHTPLRRCHKCDERTERQAIHPQTYEPIPRQQAEQDKELEYRQYKRWEVPIREVFDSCLKKLDTKVYPDLVKGVRGTVGSDHTPEHLLKGILRARNDVHVNKDGTVRYDASEITLTHFKPKEVGTSVEKLKELGYDKDVHGKPLERDDQVLELKTQDLVLPACPESPEPASDTVLLNTARFIDEELTYLYGLEPYFNAKKREDLVGHLIIGLAPHTSAGMVGRIIGFSQTQGMLAHPLYHAGMRRDCDGDESCFFLLIDAFLNFSQKFLGTSRGSTMDAPLVLTTLLNPAEVDDQAFNTGIQWRYPLEFYKAAEEYKAPWDVKLKRIEDDLFKPGQFEGMGYTHDMSDINDGVLCSAYKLLPSMAEKIEAQMSLAKKIRAVDAVDVARLVIEKHFIRDTKGNLRKFSLQQFRCVHCNEKFRRPPLNGRCTKCNGKVIFTISEGSVTKYLEPSLMLARNYDVPAFLRQTLELTRVRIESYFGKDKEKQLGLADWVKV